MAGAGAVDAFSPEVVVVALERMGSATTTALRPSPRCFLDARDAEADALVGSRHRSDWRHSRRQVRRRA